MIEKIPAGAPADLDQPPMQIGGRTHRVITTCLEGKKALCVQNVDLTDPGVWSGLVRELYLRLGAQRMMISRGTANLKAADVTASLL